MRPLWLLCVLVLSLATSVHAATTYSRLALGAHFGYALSKFSPDVGYKNRRAVAIGAHLEWGLGGHFYLQPELGYVRKGTSTEDASLPSGENDQTVVYDVIESSLLLKAKFGPPALRISILGGGFFSYAVNSSLEVTSTGGVFSAANLSQSINPLDYGATMGFGGEFRTGDDSHFFIDGRYLMGLANINSVAGSTTIINTRVFLFIVGMRFWV